MLIQADNEEKFANHPVPVLGGAKEIEMIRLLIGSLRRFKLPSNY